MKRVLYVGIIGIIVLVIAAFSYPKAHTVNGADENHVAICHTDGHKTDSVIGGSGWWCDQRGGTIMIVGRQACLKGHEAGPAANGTDCYDDNIDAVLAGPYYRRR